MFAKFKSPTAVTKQINKNSPAYNQFRSYQNQALENILKNGKTNPKLEFEKV